MIAVMLARALEVAGQRVGGAMVSASRRCGPENAVAQHALGLFGSNLKATSLGQASLAHLPDLQPNGDKLGAPVRGWVDADFPQESG